MAGRESNQRRLVFSVPRPLVTHANDVLYTREGMAWIRGTLQRRYSFQEIGLRQILDSPDKESTSYRQGSVFQSQTPCTYGDWVSEHLAALAQVVAGGHLVEPLLIPAFWVAKPYVRRDLATLNVKAEPVHATVRIAEATVINKTRISHYWIRSEAAAVAAAMKIDPRPSHPGTALYLSRRGERGEGPKKREIHNDVVEAAMESAGVRVVRSLGLGPSDFAAHADFAETVFADHGSAIYNMLHWKTKRVVELFSPDYWDSSFLFFADSLGIHDYHLWRIDGSTTVDVLAQRVAHLMTQPAGVAGAVDGST